MLGKYLSKISYDAFKLHSHLYGLLTADS